MQLQQVDRSEHGGVDKFNSIRLMNMKRQEMRDELLVAVQCGTEATSGVSNVL